MGLNISLYFLQPKNKDPYTRHTLFNTNAADIESAIVQNGASGGREAETLQSISDIRPAFLDNQNGPYKQYGPISGNTLEEGPGEEVKGLISMEM